ncbi:uncharacterized protein LAESUDRAFT_643145 [Laetiporus sulphureus 93-53]|uniref:Blue (type 1) copper domain-containing protein n=1 Tax=Laetiporus sulphureus 93-53 TaxID=1314785 RepID=A0A165H842_9APHY|nr:uncharacterized protein LAESUDRAFT_643145 [Laetiporus sulphureus 93-53]KZT11377.1 hypothetical protein LAESUDRAFT_643145 [Laetiporus sulphureus 93-53]
MSSDVVSSAAAAATSSAYVWESSAAATVSSSDDTWWSSSATAAAATTEYTWSAAATSTAAATSVSVSYGSGSSNWGGYEYSECVQQCIASFGAPSATVTASATYAATTATGTSSGTTHTVIVAPTQGVLRFVPFAVNATPGDTIFYMWNANNHTVTKGSELEICNETTDAFATGEHDKGFTFTEMVNDTDPVFYFCSTPGHCEKGMFGIINPPSVENNANTSVATMMSSMLANSSTLAAMYAASNIQNNSAAASWGDNMDMGAMPEWSQSLFAENVLYTRAFLAANPEVMKADGTIDMSASNGTWVLPQDISQALSNSTTSASASSSTAAGASSTASSSSAMASTAAAATNGARSTAMSSGLVGVAAIAAVFLAL